MTAHELPAGMIRSAVSIGTVEGYMPGFGDALPRRAPQSERTWATGLGRPCDIPADSPRSSFPLPGSARDETIPG